MTYMRKRGLDFVNKILIIVPARTARGGITNYYHTLRNYFDDNIIYHYRGSRHYPYHKGFIYELLRIVRDYFLFVYKILKYDIKVVQTTTALWERSVIRDSIFIILARVLRIKVIVFYHGWNVNYEVKLDKNIFFKFLFLKADASIVLSNYQKEKLLLYNYNKRIYIETTLVDDKLLKSINTDFIEKKYRNLNSKSKITLLFLARIEREKGIFELLDAYEQIKKNYNVNLIIAGDGKAENQAMEIAKEMKLKDIEFTGFISGDEKINFFKKSHIYIFPSYTEGMPSSVLEAMAFGIPVLTTPVGGLVDFFKENKNGFFIKIGNSNSIVEKYKEMLNSKSNLSKISINNHNYALNRFLASKVAKRNTNIFNEIMCEE